MKLEVRELTDTKAEIIMSDIYPSLANALRRVLMADIPKMAIEEVEFHLGPIRDDDGNEFESVSPLFDEIIAHRLGLIPIPTDPNFFSRRDECQCSGEGCPNCTIMFTLNKKGPGANPARRFAIWALAQSGRLTHREIAEVLDVSLSRVGKTLWTLRNQGTREPVRDWMMAWHVSASESQFDDVSLSTTHRKPGSRQAKR